MLSSKQVKLLWLIWSIMLPMTFIIVYIFNPFKLDGAVWAVVAMAALMIVMALTHFRVRGTDIIMMQAVSIAVFLTFGLLIEMLLIQIAITVYVLSKRLSSDDYYRIPVNSLMFLFVSVSSGITFYLLGGETGVLSESVNPGIIPVIGYSLMVFLSNHLFLYGFRWIFLNTRKFFSKDMYWEAITTILTMPAGIILYILYSQIGIPGIIIMAIPVITLSVIFRLMNKGHEINLLLQRTSNVGQQLTEKLDVSHIINSFFNLVKNMLEVDYMYIIDFDEKGTFNLVQLYEKKEGAMKDKQLISESGISWKVGFTGRSFKADARRQWRHLSNGYLPVNVQSVISVPMRRNNQVVGVITAASEKKRAYEKQHLTILEILANFLAVAIDNAKSYEKTKQESERCPLTNLYNYRYFSTILENKYANLHESIPFSIIMIDLDHFKKINDTYGHESGNYILCGVADRLIKIIGDLGIVARYGGEEFIVFLPNCHQALGYDVAEDIRIRLSREPFILSDSILNTDNHLIYVTASIGVATAPEQGEDSLALIRNADRAMYSGAKQKGRNRVATYIG